MTAGKKVDYSDLWENFTSHNNLDALSVIYKDHFDLLLNLGLKYTVDQQTIENTVQNVFSYFIKTRTNINTVNNVSGYIIQSFRRQLFLELRKQKKTLLTDSFSEFRFSYYNPQQYHEDRQEEEQLHRIVKEIIKNLQPKQQEIIYLRFNCNLSFKEISSMLDIEVDSCYKAVYRSVKAIRSEAEKRLLTRKASSH